MGFQKGNTWGRKNKGHRDYLTPEIRKENGIKTGNTKRGKPLSDRQRAALTPYWESKRGIPQPKIRDEKHPAWVGDSVTYGALHAWVRLRLGKPQKCSDCGTFGPQKRYQWANISGKYLRELSDWIRLCISCHKKLDTGRGDMKKVWKKEGATYSRRL